MNTTTSTTTAIEPSYKKSPHHYRLAQRDEILAQIDRALLALKAPLDDAQAPTTKKFFDVLEKPGDGRHLLGGGHAKQFPAEIFAGFHPEKSPGEFFTKFVAPGDATLHAILGVSNREILPQDEIEQLRVAQAKIDELRGAMSTWSTLKAHEHFLQQQHHAISAALDAETVPSSLGLKSLDVIQSEFSAQRKSIGELQLKFGLSVFPLVMKARSEVTKILRSQMVLLEAQERDFAEGFSCPWQPSYLWRACAAFLVRHDIRLLRPPTNDLGTFEPRELLRGIIQL